MKDFIKRNPERFAFLVVELLQFLLGLICLVVGLIQKSVLTQIFAILLLVLDITGFILIFIFKKRYEQSLKPEVTNANVRGPDSVSSSDLNNNNDSNNNLNGQEGDKRPSDEEIKPQEQNE